MSDIHKTYFHRVQAQTPTKFWINNVTREEAGLSIEHGAVNCTQNPAFVWKMLTDPVEKDYAAAILDDIMKSEPDDALAIAKLQNKLIENIAEIFMPLFEQSNGKYGYVTLQEDPFKEEAGYIIEQAQHDRRNFKNIMMKIPAVPEGLKAIDHLVREGVPVLATEIMSIQQVVDVCRVCEKTMAAMKNPPVVMYAHIAGIFDEYLGKEVKRLGIDVSEDAVWQAGIAVAKKVRAVTSAHWPQVGFLDGGARGLHHFTELVGVDGGVTINWQGTAKSLIDENPAVVQRFFMPTPDEVIDELTAKCDTFRKAYYIGALKPEDYVEYGPVALFRSKFEDGWQKAVDFARDRRAGK